MLTMAQPTTEPFGLTEAMAQLRYTSADELTLAEQSYLVELVTVARQEAEALMGRCLAGPRACVNLVPSASVVEIPMPPVLITEAYTFAVASLDDDSVVTALTTDDYYIDYAYEVPRVIVEDMPGESKWVRLTYTAGYATAASIPVELVRPVYLRVAQHWTFRTGIPEREESIFVEACRRYALRGVY